MEQREFESLPLVDLGHFKGNPLAKEGVEVFLDVKELKDKTDRTLFHSIGDKNGDLVSHHSYIKDGMLHSTVQNLDADTSDYHKAQQLPAAKLIPDSWLSASVCDHDATQILLRKGAEIRFQSHYYDYRTTGYTHNFQWWLEEEWLAQK